MYHLWFGLAVRAWASVMVYPAFASLRTWVIAACSSPSTPAKKIAVMITMMPTMTEVIQVSFQLVQVILRPSARTSRRNCTGFDNGFGFFASIAAATEGGALKGVLRRI